MNQKEKPNSSPTRPYPWAICMSCLAIIAFLYLDAYTFPSILTREVVLSIRVGKTQGTRAPRTPDYSFFLQTDGGEYRIYGDLYNQIIPGDSVVLRKSSFTHRLCSASFRRGHWTRYYEEGYLRAGWGRWVLPLLFLAILLLFMRKHTIEGRRMALFSGILLALTVLQLFFYLH